MHWKTKESVQFLAAARDVSHLCSIQTSCEAHPVSCLEDTMSSLARHEADQASPYHAEVKDVWSHISTPQYIFMA
jgi:hypothetical protein